MDRPLRSCLVVDDNDVDRAVFRRYLEQDLAYGYACFEARTGAEALGLLEDRDVDCVLLDYRLPDMDGLAFLRAWADAGRSRQPRAVVMVTGQGSEQVATEALKHGVDNYLVKEDCSPDALRRAVAGAVEKARLKAHLAEKQQEVERERARLEQILASISDGFFALDREGRFTYVNAEAERLLQRSREHLLGRHIWEAYADAVGSPFYEAYQRTLETGEAAHSEAYYEPLAAWFSVHYYPHEGYPHEGGLSVYFRNVTEQRVGARRLQESEEQFRTLFESMTEGVVYQDAGGAITAANPAAERLLGLSHDELVGRTSQDPRWRATDAAGHDLLAGRHPAMEALRTGQVIRDRVMGVYNPRWGEQRWLLVDAVPKFEAGAERPCGVYAFFRNVTRQRRAEEALREREKQFRRVVEAAPSGIILTDAESRIVMINPHAERVFGYAPGELLGQPVDVLVPERLREKHYAWRRRYLRAPVARPMGAGRDLFARRKDGAEFPVEIGLTPLAVSEGPMVLVTVVDIAERKQAEETLRESETRFRGTFENAAVGIAHVGLEGAWLRVNERLCEIVGYPHAELLAKTYQELTHPSDRYLDRASISALRQGEINSSRVEKRYVRRDGQVVWVEVTSALQRDADGAPLYRIAVVHDISERRRLARRFTEARKQAERSLGQLKAVVESMSDALLVADADGNFLDWNRAALEMHGFERVEQARRHLSQFPDTFALSDLGGRVIPLERWPMARLLAGEDVAGYEVRIHRRDTGKTWVGSFNGALVRDEQDRPLRAVLTIRDVTEQKQAEEALRQAKEQAEALAHAKSVFLANMSHEIRTPLTSILGFASILAGEVTDEHREFAQLIEKSGKRLLDTLNAVLTLARLEADRVSLDLQPLDVTEEARDVLQLHRAAARAKHLTLDLHPGPGADAACALLDRGAFSSILQNLVANAIKFTTEGGVMVTVETTGAPAEDAPAWVHVHVDDTGNGIEEAFLPRLFVEFQQESSGVGRRYEGTGLGLAIARRLTEMMGGQIEVHSRKEVGSRFTVRFPCCVASATGQENHVPEAARDRLRPEAPAPLLLVEDNPDTRLLICELLRDAFNVTTAENADEALAAARRTPFELVLLDIHLGPGPSGDQVLQALRAMPGYRETPIIALTAHALPGDRERFLRLGFTEHLPKPFDVDRFLERAVAMLPNAQ